jgi:hypothetical protein
VSENRTQPEQLPPDDLWAELDDALNHSDASDHLLEARVAALEEAAASWRGWWRLRRSLRRSARAYRWTGSFRAARGEQSGYDYHVLRDRQRARWDDR